ncbi:hypothetical protein AtDm6_2699 [Acetobacter tropicalis]|uniref:Uncharacterized protein n=2 Tax=Acetobacter tropicalis TaxID=104102 RepID=A0A095AYW1_9PROT|nr:hypothetical protein AtDm6_2699 [Acetobacter tropicalis]
MDAKELIKAAGGCVRLAEICGLKSHTTPLRWKTVPVAHLRAIEAALGIPRHVMRPDIFDVPSGAGVAT